MDNTRHLIVNADDFGQSAGITRGIIEAFEHGIVTSTSMMVRWPAAPEAAEYARSHPGLSVGLHVDLGEWVFESDEWKPLYEVVSKDDAMAVSREVASQIESFQKLVGRNPTHIDSHQHLHRREPVCSILKKSAEGLGVPLRLYSKIQYCGAFYGQTETGAPLPSNITVDALMAVLSRLPAGITELACHPAKHIDLEIMYASERLQELSVLCNSQIPEFLARQDIHLCSFETTGVFQA